MRTWYRVRYNLPPTDPRYLDLTDEDIQLEYWTIQAHIRPPGTTEFDTPGFDDDLSDLMAGNLDDPSTATPFADIAPDFETVTPYGG